MYAIFLLREHIPQHTPNGGISRELPGTAENGLECLGTFFLKNNHISSSSGTTETLRISGNCHFDCLSLLTLETKYNFEGNWQGGVQSGNVLDQGVSRFPTGLPKSLKREEHTFGCYYFWVTQEQILHEFYHPLCISLNMKLWENKSDQTITYLQPITCFTLDGSTYPIFEPFP